MLKMAIITGFLSKTKDRFHEYNAPLALDEKFALMADIDGYDGVEIVYPYEVNDAAATRQSYDKYGLTWRPSTSTSRPNRNFATAA
jgi:xylose isomerase